MIWINIKLALAAIRSAKLRSFLTMLAVAIGVVAFILITTTFEGLKASVTDQVSSLGGNLVTINSGDFVERDEEGKITGINFESAFGATTLRENDLTDVSNIEGVDAAVPQMIITATVKRGDTNLSGSLVMATNEQYPAALNQNVEKGRFFEADEADKRIVVVGQKVIEDLLGGSLVIGSTIKIKNQSFTIIGSMEEFAAGNQLAFGPNINKAVFIPFGAGKELNGGVAQLEEIDVQLSDAVDGNAVIQQIEAEILENHGGEKDFTVLRQDELIEVSASILDVFKSGSQAISYVMLFVSSLVIMLIMLITVTERTHEIGIRKSIGANNSNILTQFLTEAIVLSWVGSLVGAILAFFFGLLVDITLKIEPVFSVPTAIVVVMIATIIGAIAGIYPAYLAAKKDPVEALRHE